MILKAITGFFSSMKMSWVNVSLRISIKDTYADYSN
jgi:hypothetical protein